MICIVKIDINDEVEENPEEEDAGEEEDEEII